MKRRNRDAVPTVSDLVRLQAQAEASVGLGRRLGTYTYTSVGRFNGFQCKIIPTFPHTLTVPCLT